MILVFRVSIVFLSEQRAATNSFSAEHRLLAFRGAKSATDTKIAAMEAMKLTAVSPLLWAC